MKSPFTGGNATLRQEVSELSYRKETFKYVHHYYECDDTKERFTTTSLDEINLAQVHNQYRAKYGIPFPDEIAAIRKRYGLSAKKMSMILGFGDNQYRLYENGDMPSETNGKTLMSIKKPYVFKTFLENSQNQFSKEDYSKICRKVEQSQMPNEEAQKSFLFSSLHRDASNGYAEQSVQKLENILLYFIRKFNGVFFTMMNKLLFYTDFYSYKTRAVGMTGLSYQAIQYGPVPTRWDRIYSFFDSISSEIIQFPNGEAGTKLVTGKEFDASVLSEEEINILDMIYQRFKNNSAKEISEISHQEDAWRNFYGKKEPIDYNRAFYIKAI